MIIRVDLRAGCCSLDDPADFTAFHVLVEGAADGATSATVVSTLGADGGAVDDDHVFVAVDAVRRLAGSRDQHWDAGFAGMLGYAESKGWMSSDGSMIRAHVEWADRGVSPA